MAELEQILSVLASARPRAARPEALVARAIVEPPTLGELGELVRRCEIERLSLAPLGACRSLAQMRREPVDVGIALDHQAEVIDYEPDDMTVVVGAGLTLGALNALLRQRGQYLPLDPPHPELTTIGALIGAARSGPMRHWAGMVRDYLIGIQFVGHGGVLVRGGGRVVKNVAGYDLMKVIAGTFGTLGIVTKATFKVRPLPETSAAGVLYFGTMNEAFEAAFALHENLPLLYLEILSPEVKLQARSHKEDDGFMLVAGAAGNRAEVDYLTGEMAKRFAGAEVCAGAAAQELYKALRDLTLDLALDQTGGQAGATTLALAALPREMPALLGAEPMRFRAHVGAGLAQAAFVGLAPEQEAAAIGRMRARAAAARGHLRLLTRAPALGEVPYFDQPPAATLKLMRALKQTFDPAGIFNPGCFVGGI